jgi:hypothetical protein
VLLACVVIYATYKVTILELFPWLNVLISSSLSFIVFVLSFLVKGKNKSIQLVLLSFFILQLFLNYSILQNSDLLLKNWRWLFYPVSFFIYILSISVALKKGSKLISFALIGGSFLVFVVGFFSINPIWLTLQMLFFILFSVEMIITKNNLKPKAKEVN